MKFRHGWAGPALLCLLLASVHTWPLATRPATLSSHDNADAQLNEWILAWIAHQLPRSPMELFQANIFYPARDTLAFSEPLIVPALLGAPVAWLGGSPVLVFNLLVLAGFALTAFAGYVLIVAWTGDRTAAMLAGSTFAFNTHTLTRIPHVQALHLYALPLALLAVDRLLSEGRTRDAVWLAVWMTVMAYSSGYLFVFGAIAIAVVVVARAHEWLPRFKPVGGRLALAALASGLLILPLWRPYHRAATQQGMVRSLDNVAEYSATPQGYLAASGTIHHATWSAGFFRDPVDSFFPGFVVIGLALVAVWGARSGSAAARRRVVMLVAIAVTGVVLSLGTRTPVYGWIYHVFPPMQGLRAAARFGNLFLLGMSALAGLGLAGLWRSGPVPSEPDSAPRVEGPRSRRTAIAAMALVAAANLESLRAPFEYRPFEGIPRVYGLLAAEPRVVLAEVPFYPRQAAFENAEYVLNSTAHWRPLMNGYSGYTPASYTEYANTFWYFPRAHAIEAMRRAGVTHVMVHPARFGHEADAVLAELGTRPEFELMAVGSRGLRLYRLR